MRPTQHIELSEGGETESGQKLRRQCDKIKYSDEYSDVKRQQNGEMWSENAANRGCNVLV